MALEHPQREYKHIVTRRGAGVFDVAMAWRAFDTSEAAIAWLADQGFTPVSALGGNPYVTSDNTQTASIGTVRYEPSPTPPPTKPDTSKDPKVTERDYYHIGWAWAVEEFPNGWKPMESRINKFPQKLDDLRQGWEDRGLHPSTEIVSARHVWLRRGYDDAKNALAVK